MDSLFYSISNSIWILLSRSLTNMSALDEVQLKKNGEVLKKLKSPKRKKARSLKRLGFVNGDAISVLLPAIQDDLTSGEARRPLLPFAPPPPLSETPPLRRRSFTPRSCPCPFDAHKTKAG